MHKQLAYEDDDIKCTAPRRAFSSPIGVRNWITPSSKVSAAAQPEAQPLYAPKTWLRFNWSMFSAQSMNTTKMVIDRAMVVLPFLNVSARTLKTLG
jgi:hypothetical protein